MNSDYAKMYITPSQDIEQTNSASMPAIGRGVDFDVKLAHEDPVLKPLVNMPGVDAFSLNIDPFYQVNKNHINIFFLTLNV